MDDQIVKAWDALHQNSRFRPAYPSESVVRFTARHFGGIGDPADRPARLLDIGTGAGRHALMMADAGHTVTAVDVSQEGLVHAKRCAQSMGIVGISFEKASMTDLPFEDRSFDGAVSYGVFLYGDKATFAKAVSEAYRVLRDGGWLLVVTRSVSDLRFGLGEEIEAGTVVLSDNSTNEAGMTMHFLDEDAISKHFRQFRRINVDYVHHSLRSRAIENSDWVIEAMK